MIISEQDVTDLMNVSRDLIQVIRRSDKCTHEDTSLCLDAWIILNRIYSKQSKENKVIE